MRRPCKNMGKAVCGSSQSPTQEVTSDMSFTISQISCKRFCLSLARQDLPVCDAQNKVPGFESTNSHQLRKMCECHAICIATSPSFQVSNFLNTKLAQSVEDRIFRGSVVVCKSPMVNDQSISTEAGVAIRLVNCPPTAQGHR